MMWSICAIVTIAVNNPLSAEGGRHKDLSLFRFLHRASNVPTMIARPTISPMKRKIAALVPRDHMFNPHRERGGRSLLDYGIRAAAMDQQQPIRSLPTQGLLAARSCRPASNAGRLFRCPVKNRIYAAFSGYSLRCGKSSLFSWLNTAPVSKMTSSLTILPSANSYLVMPVVLSLLPVGFSLPLSVPTTVHCTKPPSGPTAVPSFVMLKSG